nr:hypothetical protein [Fodinicola feengrottensis]
MLLFGPPAAAAPVPRPAPLALDEELPDLAQYGAQSANGGVLRPWPARTVEVDGTPIVVRDTPGRAGSEPALYVHGLGGSSTNWTDLAGLLAPLVGRAGARPARLWRQRSAAGRRLQPDPVRRDGDPLDRAVWPRPGASVRELARRGSVGTGRGYSTRRPTWSAP